MGLQLKNIADKSIPKVKTNPFDVVKFMKQDTITNTLVNAIQTVSETLYPSDDSFDKFLQKILPPRVTGLFEDSKWNATE